MKRVLLSFLSVLICVSLMSVSASAILTTASYVSSGDISPAIAVLRNSSELNVNGITGNSVVFTRNSFDSLVGKQIKYITVTSIPANGTLKIGGVAVISGQTVAASSLDFMTYSSENGKNDFFTFRVDSSEWEYIDIPCNIYFSSSLNTSPILSGGEIFAACNASTEVFFDITEPDGDYVEFSVKSYPYSGTVSVKDGYAVYTPKNGFTGKDEFVISASDIFGNKSEDAVFNVTVSESSVNFTDMEMSPAHTAAIMLAEKDIVTYKRTAGGYFYEPTLPVTRIDFLVMLMSTVGISASTGAELPFEDINAVSTGRKKYLARAVELGIVNATEKYFRPFENITLKESIEWAKQIEKDGDFEVFENTEDIDADLDREQAALILFKMLG